MNVVLYTRDMEPITVIDLPLWALEFAQRMGRVRIEAADPVDMNQLIPGQRVDSLRFHIVTLEFHRLLLSRDRESWIVTVDDDVLALKLRPAWLPGQRAKINQYESETKKLAGMLLDVLSRGVGGH
jgi:hypothetical protein